MKYSPLVRTSIQLNIGARKVSRDIVCRQQYRTRLILAKRLSKLIQERLKNDAARQTSIAIEVCLGELRPSGTIVCALVDDEVLTVWWLVGGSGEDDRISLFAVLVEEDGAGIAANFVWPVGRGEKTVTFWTNGAEGTLGHATAVVASNAEVTTDNREENILSVCSGDAGSLGC